MTRPSIAICIPSKDRPADIVRCLKSIAVQERHPEQIIIIDQSKEKYDLEEIPNLIHVYDPTITGSASARNLAWSLSSSQAVFFIDDDVELLPNCLTALDNALEKYPNAVGFQCSIVGANARFSLNKLHAIIFHRGFFNASRFRDNDPPKLRRLAGGATAFRSWLRNYERFDECLVGYSYGEDWEFSYRAGSHGDLILVSNAHLIHHTSAVNRFRTEQLLRDRWDNFLYFYDKLNAKELWFNRFWRVWWMLGESIHWVRLGMGFPIFGLRSKNAPSKSMTRQVDRPRTAQR